jgi:hypothetical protein
MTLSNQNKITFLLGAGTSIPAQMPSTEDITNKILCGKCIKRHSSGNYSCDLPSNFGFPDEYVPRILKLLRTIKIEIDNYYKNSSRFFTNYEDIYYVTSQIEDSESGKYDNPIVQPFIDKILPRIQQLFSSKKSDIKQSWRLQEIANEATNYIRDIVWHMLSNNVCCLDYLSCLKDSCLDNQLSNIDIFTLNHDKIIEKYLSQNKIRFDDGFDEPINGVRYWNPDLFESHQLKVRLFKLHGSINWFKFRPDGGNWDQESIGIPLDSDINHTKNKNGQLQMPIDGRPMFLAGTFNKMLEYTSGIYFVLHYQFYRSLQYAKRLIVCGYGFGDKGINTRIIEWIYSTKQNKIIIIHPRPEDLKDRARGAISNKWEEWINDKRLFIISKKIEETSWQDIKDSFEE